MAFRDAGRGEAFLPNLLRQERDKLREHADDITVEQSQFFEEIRGASIKFITIEAVVEFLEYSGTLVEKVYLLSREVSEKNKVFASFLYFYPR